MDNRYYAVVDVTVAADPGLPPEWQAVVDRHWAQLEAQGTSLFRGPVLRALHLERDGPVARITAGWTDYAHLVADRAGLLPAAYACRPLFGAAVAVTRDGRLLFGRMHPATSHPGRWQLPGGGVDPADVVDGHVVAERVAGRELLEEVGLGPDAVAETRRVGGWIDDGGSGALGVLFRLRRTWDEVARTFAAFVAGEAEPEFTELRGVAGPADLPEPVACLSEVWARWWWSTGTRDGT
jgi:8-oxo-dGTP pyrophosphatase MutT (NUDIX family)